MIRLIAVLCAAVMMLSGCGCTNDTNDDGIIGNDQAPGDNSFDDNANDSVDDGAANDGMMGNNMAEDDAIVDNNDQATDATGARSGGMMGRAVDNMGNAMEDVGRGAGNVMRDVGRGANNVMRDVGNAMR